MDAAALDPLDPNVDHGLDLEAIAAWEQDPAGDAMPTTSRPPRRNLLPTSHGDIVRAGGGPAARSSPRTTCKHRGPELDVLALDAVVNLYAVAATVALAGACAYPRHRGRRSAGLLMLLARVVSDLPGEFASLLKLVQIVVLAVPLVRKFLLLSRHKHAIFRDFGQSIDRDVQMLAQSEETGLDLHDGGSTSLHGLNSYVGLLKRGREFVTIDAGNGTDFVAVDVADVHFWVETTEILFLHECTPALICPAGRLTIGPQNMCQVAPAARPTRLPKKARPATSNVYRSGW